MTRPPAEPPTPWPGLAAVWEHGLPGFPAPRVSSPAERPSRATSEREPDEITVDFRGIA